MQNQGGRRRGQFTPTSGAFSMMSRSSRGSAGTGPRAYQVTYGLALAAYTNRQSKTVGRTVGSIQSSSLSSVTITHSTTARTNAYYRDRNDITWDSEKCTVLPAGGARDLPEWHHHHTLAGAFDHHQFMYTLLDTHPLAGQ